MSNTNQWTVKELSKHIANHVLSADAIEYFINELLGQKKKESGTSLPVTGESEAIEKAIIEELQSILSSGVHPEYLPEKINDRISELKGDKSYT